MYVLAYVLAEFSYKFLSRFDLRPAFPTVIRSIVRSERKKGDRGMAG